MIGDGHNEQAGGFVAFAKEKMAQLRGFVTIGERPTSAVNLEELKTPSSAVEASASNPEPPVQETPEAEAEQAPVFPPEEENLRQEYVNILNGLLVTSGMNEAEYKGVVTLIDALLNGQNYSAQDIKSNLATQTASDAFSPIFDVLNGSGDAEAMLFNPDFSRTELFNDPVYLQKIKAVWDEAVNTANPDFLKKE